MDIANCRIIDLPKISDVRGNLSFVENCNHIPFEIKRVYYLYDVPGGSVRGGHAHRQLHQLIVSVAGSFEVVLGDGEKEKVFHLNRSHYGVYVCPMIWRSLRNFSSGAVSLVLASNLYDESDYIRDYQHYLQLVGKK